MITSGTGVGFGGAINTLYQTYELNRPYQLCTHQTDYIRPWIYVAPEPDQGWSWRPTIDLNCFLLPLGNCRLIHVEVPEEEVPQRRTDFDEEAYQRLLL
jgi:hypothetical protein